MKQIKNNINSTYIVNKSKFIAFAFKVKSLKEVNNYLDELKVKYFDATHICYAYNFYENNQLFSAYHESTEPKNSSGRQIYNLIINKKLINILIVIIRYFGNQKLGIGLLTRSYLVASKNVIENNLIDYVEKNNVYLTIPINFYNTFIKICQIYCIDILNKVFDNLDVKLEILVSKKDFENSNILEIINRYKNK